LTTLSITTGDYFAPIQPSRSKRSGHDSMSTSTPFFRQLCACGMYYR